MTAVVIAFLVGGAVGVAVGYAVALIIEARAAGE